MQYQALLPSGKGIRYRELSPTECDKLAEDAAIAIGVDKDRDNFTTFIQQNSVQTRLGVKRMLMAVTKDSGIADILTYAGEWKKLTLQDVDDKYDQLFTSKDHEALKLIYSRLHNLSNYELEAISKKALPVSEG